MAKEIVVTWIDKDTEEIIFEDHTDVEGFKKLHDVSPHTCCDCGYHDVVIRIPWEKELYEIISLDDKEHIR